MNLKLVEPMSMIRLWFRRFFWHFGPPLKSACYVYPDQSKAPQSHIWCRLCFFKSLAHKDFRSEIANKRGIHICKAGPLWAKLWIIRIKSAAARLAGGGLCLYRRGQQKWSTLLGFGLVTPNNSKSLIWIWLVNSCQGRTQDFDWELRIGLEVIY